MIAVVPEKVLNASMMVFMHVFSKYVKHMQTSIFRNAVALGRQTSSYRDHRTSSSDSRRPTQSKKSILKMLGKSICKY